MSSADNATIAAKELTHALLHPALAAPFATIGDDQLVALKQLALIFEQAATQETHTSNVKNTAPSPRVADKTSAGSP